MSYFKPIKRDTSYLFPPSMNDSLPEHHFARFVVDIVEQLNLKPLECAYRGSGSTPLHPALLLSLLVYGYATYDSVAFRLVAADEHPDHDTLNSFRSQFDRGARRQ